MRKVVMARSTELATGQRGDDHPVELLHVGAAGNRQVSVGSAQENRGACGLYTDSPGSTMRVTTPHLSLSSPSSPDKARESIGEMVLPWPFLFSPDSTFSV